MTEGSVDWFKENDADTGDSLRWGAIASGTKRFETAIVSASASVHARVGRNGGRNNPQRITAVSAAGFGLTTSTTIALSRS